MEHILSLSYGKDSLACLGAIEELGLPLDRIIHAEVWATDTIPADLPEMVEFKKKADKIIFERYAIKVEHIRHKLYFEKMLYQKKRRGKYIGEIRGFPLAGKSAGWCKNLKIMNKLSPKNAISYVGIAFDEPNRFHNLSETKISPLVDARWTEDMCREWCVKNDLLSPIYTTATRGGCWFCPNQGVEQLRILRKSYPEYWALMLKWDLDSPVLFHADGHTVHDFEKRFALEDAELIPMDRQFRWEWLNNPPGTQMRLF